MPSLTQQEYQSTLADKMTLVQPNDEIPNVDLKQYLATIPQEDLAGQAFGAWDIERVYKGSDGTYMHLLLPSAGTNKYLVVVVRLAPPAIYGHYLLDLDQEYGLKH